MTNQLQGARSVILRYDPYRNFHRPPVQAWRAASLASARTARYSPVRLDAFRYSDHIGVVLDLPGVDPDTIEVTVQDSILSIKAERSRPETEGEETLISER